jgi:hypothetical protein
MGEVMMDGGWEADTDHEELVAARQRLVGLDAEIQQLRRDMLQLERDKRDAARELEAFRHTAQAPKAQQADKPSGADPRFTEITALLHSLQQDISGLTRAATRDRHLCPAGINAMDPPPMPNGFTAPE